MSTSYVSRLSTLLKRCDCNVNYNHLQTVSLPVNTCSVYCLSQWNKRHQIVNRLLWETGRCDCRGEHASIKLLLRLNERSQGFILPFFSFIKCQFFHACMLYRIRERHFSFLFVRYNEHHASINLLEHQKFNKVCYVCPDFNNSLLLWSLCAKVYTLLDLYLDIISTLI